MPLELGGAPDDVRNLWPQPRVSADSWRADQKDELEFALNRLVCAGQLSLADAQRAVAIGRTAAYRLYLAPEE